MPNNIYDVIIIGLGPAGMTAGIYCARKGLNTLIIGKEAGGQVAKSAEIANYLGFGFSTGTELTKAFKDHIAKFSNLNSIENILVKSISKKRGFFEIKTEDKKVYQSKSIIIASGRNPKKLEIPGEKEFINRGVSYCEVCDGPLFKGKITCVIGAGNSGLTAAISLAQICSKVYILNLAGKMTGDKILQDKIKKFKNCVILNNSQITEIIGNKFVSGLKYVDLNSGREKLLKVDGIFIEIGWVPAIDFDKITKKNKWHEIIVDKQCRTNILGIFAAGDITDVGYWQIVIAAGEGAKAALSAFEYLSKS